MRGDAAQVAFQGVVFFNECILRIAPYFNRAIFYSSSWDDAGDGSS
ncbi:MAG TPA: hypothetical protein VMA34_08395 [Terracidiphilus sp.]|nr:hypothetical protein [Terracidiphilus sp.]